MTRRIAHHAFDSLGAVLKPLSCGLQCASNITLDCSLLHQHTCMHTTGRTLGQEGGASCLGHAGISPLFRGFAIPGVRYSGILIEAPSDSDIRV